MFSMDLFKFKEGKIDKLIKSFICQWCVPISLNVDVAIFRLCHVSKQVRLLRLWPTRYNREGKDPYVNCLLHSLHRKQFLCHTLRSALTCSMANTVLPQDLQVGLAPRASGVSYGKTPQVKR